MKIKKFSQAAARLGPSLCLGLVLAATVVCTTLPAQAQLPDVTGDYTIQTIESPPNADITAIFVVFINERGMPAPMVVMQYNQSFSPGSPYSQGHVAIRENGVWTIIDVPGSAWTGTGNPNASGRVGLVYADSSGNWHNAIYHQGTYTYLPDYKAAPGQPPYQYGVQLINDHRIMTGLVFDPTGNCIDPNTGFYCVHGLLLDTSLALFQMFDYPGALATAPLGINDAGQIVGQYDEMDGTFHCFFSDGGKTFVNLDPPGSGYGAGQIAFMINNKGDICGGYDDAVTGVQQGFLLRQGKFASFNVPTSTSTTLTCITDQGRLAGVYLDQQSNPHGFIATPKPGGK